MGTDMGGLNQCRVGVSLSARSGSTIPEIVLSSLYFLTRQKVNLRTDRGNTRPSEDRPRFFFFIVHC